MLLRRRGGGGGTGSSLANLLIECGILSKLLMKHTVVFNHSTQHMVLVC